MAGCGAATGYWIIACPGPDRSAHGDPAVSVHGGHGVPRCRHMRVAVPIRCALCTVANLTPAVLRHKGILGIDGRPGADVVNRPCYQCRMDVVRITHSGNRRITVAGPAGRRSSPNRAGPGAVTTGAGTCTEAGRGQLIILGDDTGSRCTVRHAAGHGSRHVDLAVPVVKRSRHDMTGGTGIGRGISHMEVVGTDDASLGVVALSTLDRDITGRGRLGIRAMTVSTGCYRNHGSSISQADGKQTAGHPYEQ